LRPPAQQSFALAGGGGAGGKGIVSGCMKCAADQRVLNKVEVAVASVVQAKRDERVGTCTNVEVVTEIELRVLGACGG
jgi:hypothetical protein